MQPQSLTMNWRHKIGYRFGNISYCFKRIAEELLANTNPMTNEINEELARDLKALWHDPAIQKAMGRSSEFQLYDSTE